MDGGHVYGLVTRCRGGRNFRAPSPLPTWSFISSIFDFIPQRKRINMLGLLKITNSIAVIKNQHCSLSLKSEPFAIWPLPPPSTTKAQLDSPLTWWPPRCLALRLASTSTSSLLAYMSSALRQRLRICSASAGDNGDVLLKAWTGMVGRGERMEREQLHQKLALSLIYFVQFYNVRWSALTWHNAWRLIILSFCTFTPPRLDWYNWNNLHFSDEWTSLIS